MVHAQPVKIEIKESAKGFPSITIRKYCEDLTENEGVVNQYLAAVTLLNREV